MIQNIFQYRTDFFFGLLFTFFLLFSPSHTFGQNEVQLDRIVAVVDGEIILFSEVNALVYNILQQQNQKPTDFLVRQYYNNALQELVNQKVLYSHAERDTTIKVSDDRVNQELDRRMRGLIDQVGGEDRFEMEYGKSILQAKNDFRENVRQQIKANEFQEKKLSQIKISPREVERWFKRIPQDSLPTLPETVRMSHIVRLPDIPATARDEARRIASALRDSILTGRSKLENLARRYTDDPGSRNTGGRGRAKLSQLVPEFGAVASSLAPGGISQVFESQFGMHVMRVNTLQGEMLDYSHILIKINDRNANPTNAIAFLKTLRDSINTRKVTFEALAKRHSQDPQSASLGGAVINFQTGSRDLALESLNPRWRVTLNKLEPGQLSEPLETELLDGRKAWHIVWLQKRSGAHTVNLQDDYQIIEQQALNDKKAQVMTEWLERLRQGVYIKINEVSP
ncbi:MAG: peptidylprolyl isomerase [Bacteroidetes Order II. Incertae sedis bacterium]|nr:peptidylprolyl isomerase [Bacteroidetes Order II. bacterium]